MAPRPQPGHRAPPLPHDGWTGSPAAGARRRSLAAACVETAVETAVEVAAETAGLLAPRRCPCGTPGTRLCPACASLLAGPPRRVESGCEALQVVVGARLRPTADGPLGIDLAPLLPVLALGRHQGDLRTLVLAWKNGGQAHLVAALGAALAPAVRRLAGEGPVALVPAPSRRAARLRRGEDPVLELARDLARRSRGPGGPPDRVLRAAAAPASSQGGRDARSRRDRTVPLRRAPAPGTPVVLVDDVLTTGATLRSLHAELTAAGAEVRGAVVVAAARTPPGTADGGPAGAARPDAAGTGRVGRHRPDLP